MRRKRAAWMLGLILLALIIAGASVLAGAWRQLTVPLDPAGVPQTIRIAPGETLRQVQRHLVAKGLVAPGAPLALWARLTGKDRAVKSGYYELSPADSPRRILDALINGETVMLAVTVPEGLIQSEILARLAAGLELPIDSLRAAAADAAFLDSLGLPRASLDGYMCPETYRFERGVAARRVLETMVRGCWGWFDGRRRQRADSLGLSLHEVLTLASIIEAETTLAWEKPRISAVYHRRLRLGWLLQADPTVAFAVGRTGQRLWQKHLEFDSPYNTYLYRGLPPGPICSPGLASIDAALWPAADCEDLYFVAGGDGAHIFSRTLREHNRAKQAARRGR